MQNELCEYTAVLGALARLIERFNPVTRDMFRKHGMDLVFLSRTEYGEDSKNEIVYVLRFDSYDEVEKRWTAFFADRSGRPRQWPARPTARSWRRCGAGSSRQPSFPGLADGSALLGTAAIRVVCTDDEQ